MRLIQNLKDISLRKNNLQFLIEKILNKEEFLSKPPVLIDIGASGQLHKIWKYIAPHSICVAFDGDDRDFKNTESDKSGYKKLIILNRIVSDISSEETKFYLTESPHCSSALKPNLKALKKWDFCELFEISRVVTMPSISLVDALSSCGIDYIDWYKSDTQGTDLRIFNSVPTDIRKNIKVAEFEPGIIDAYYQEDKLHKLMEYMEGESFWVSKMQIKGAKRIEPEERMHLSRMENIGFDLFLSDSPGWCEITYINNFESPSKRDYLLGWIFSSILMQHGFAFKLALSGKELFKDCIFDEMAEYSKYIFIANKGSNFLKLLKLIYRKCISWVH